MVNNEKIQSSHLARQAVVYLRQSTLKQLHEHKESTARQYGLKKRALELGWPDQKVTVIADDLGQSGASAEWREGFQRLAEDVAHGRVGGIFALEVSRLARSSADWHRLVELCSLADVVIADEQSVYCPNDYNDRLLLGLKGTMSEAEQYWMRLRLEGGRLSKARRGEFYLTPPAGYEWDRTTSRYRMDPDEGVQRAIRLIFERFRLDGSGYRVARYFGRSGLMLPCREFSTRELLWVKPRYTLVLSILHNPIYAGAYVFGRTEQRMGLSEGKLRRRICKTMPMDAWKAVIQDRHPGYISWEEFMENQKKLEENRTFRFEGENRGAAREGHALLQGLALCGRCGRRMSTRYQGRYRRVQYTCVLNHVIGEKTLCWGTAGENIDRLVEKLFLETVTSNEIDLALNVAHETERQITEIECQWKLKIERIQYEVRLAERRYKATDPDNRVVARTLEREWEEKLRELEEAHREHQEAQHRERLELTSEDRQQIRRLATDLRAVWNSETTTHAERKNFLRMLIREITLSPVEIPKMRTRIQVWWHTGATSELFIDRRDKFTALATPEETVVIVREMFEKNQTDEEIAAELNRRALPRAHHLPRKNRGPWDVPAIRRIRYTYGLYQVSPRARKAAHRRDDGMYSIHGVAQALGVTPGTVKCWVHAGKLQASYGGGSAGRPLWFRLDEGVLTKLNIEKAKRNR